MTKASFIMLSFLIAISFFLFANMPDFIKNSSVGSYAYIGLFVVDIAGIVILKK